MANSYLYPGVYIEEISARARSIEAVGTNVAAFLGEAPRADVDENQIVWINNWTEFCRHFVDLPEEPESTSEEKTVTESETTNQKEFRSTPLSHAVCGFFLNGGGRCCVINVGKDGPLTGNGDVRNGLDLLELTDEVSIVAAPGRTDSASHDQLISHCEKMRNRIAILDPPDQVTSISDLAGELRPRESDLGFGAFYFPNILVQDPLDPKRPHVSVSPSGHIAGIYARTDACRGVHKAPANEPIRGAFDVSYRLTHDEQDILNPNGVNCIRLFPHEGVVVYGARTIAAQNSEWRYLNVRRLLIMIEESISRSTRWAVFEPNDAKLWDALRRDVNAFLTTIWRQGALMGATVEEAFFVKCDGETNQKYDIDQGRINIIVGVAPVKPAEFVIFQISQNAADIELDSKPE